VNFVSELGIVNCCYFSSEIAIADNLVSGPKITEADLQRPRPSTFCQPLGRFGTSPRFGNSDRT